MSFDATKYVQSRWLKGSDLPPNQQIRVTVKAVYEHEFAEQNQTKPVLSFIELPQELPCNKTQVGAMIAAFGPNAGLWVGQALYLQQVPSNYAGKPTILIVPAPSAIPSAMSHGIPAQQQAVLQQPQVDVQFMPTGVN